MKPETFIPFVYTIIALILTTNALAIPPGVKLPHQHQNHGLMNDNSMNRPGDVAEDTGSISVLNGQGDEMDTVSNGERVEYPMMPNDQDTDNDGLSDEEEINTYGTSATESDTDNDGIDDSTEITVTQTDPTNPDTDGDGLNDGDEVNIHATDPNNVDTDGDGCTDYEELNDSTDPLNPDTDGDGLNDCEEKKVHATDPNNPDTDDDGFKDGEEVTFETDPLDNEAYPRGRFKGGCASVGHSSMTWAFLFTGFVVMTTRKRQTVKSFNSRPHSR